MDPTQHDGLISNTPRETLFTRADDDASDQSAHFGKAWGFLAGFIIIPAVVLFLLAQGEPFGDAGLAWPLIGGGLSVFLLFHFVLSYGASESVPVLCIEMLILQAAFTAIMIAVGIFTSFAVAALGCYLMAIAGALLFIAHFLNTRRRAHMFGVGAAPALRSWIVYVLPLLLTLPAALGPQGYYASLKDHKVEVYVVSAWLIACVYAGILFSIYLVKDLTTEQHLYTSMRLFTASVLIAPALYRFITDTPPTPKTLNVPVYPAPGVMKAIFTGHRVFVLSFVWCLIASGAIAAESLDGFQDFVKDNVIVVWISIATLFGSAILSYVTSGTLQFLAHILVITSVTSTFALLDCFIHPFTLAMTAFFVFGTLITVSGMAVGRSSPSVAPSISLTSLGGFAAIVFCVVLFWGLFRLIDTVQLVKVEHGPAYKVPFLPSALGALWAVLYSCLVTRSAATLTSSSEPSDRMFPFVVTVLLDALLVVVALYRSLSDNRSSEDHDADNNRFDAVAATTDARRQDV